MIAYGIKSKALASESILDPCPECGKSNTTTLHIFQKYVHVFFIPFLPAGKTVVSDCSNCKKVLNKKEMPASFTMAFDNTKANFKTPIWMFSGLALALVLIAWGIYTDKQNDAKNALLIVAPQSGDVYDIKTAENQYTIYKVEKVERDSVFVRTSNFEVNKVSGIGDIKSKGNSAYSEDLFGFS